jgi:hypothetical protein
MLQLLVFLLEFWYLLWVVLNHDMPRFELRAVFSIVFPYLRIHPTLPIPYVLSHTGSVDRTSFLIRPVYHIEILIRTVRARILIYGSGGLGVQG